MKLELVPVPTSDSTGRSPSTPRNSASPSTSTPTPRSGPRRPADPPGSAGSIVLSTGLDAISDMVPVTVKGLYLVVNDIASAREELLGRAVAVGDPGPGGWRRHLRQISDPDGQHTCASTDGLAN